ncbi:hypothetical protein MW887_011822 [Aspergillus wentii]|nr:hypothetical protein MW887_011822 [Aspergillus wentii]
MPVSASSDIAYCSTVNTGSSFNANSSIYQSNGACQELCNADYAFGILMDKRCWCSNIAPNKATNVDVSECSDGCPGYPADSCGNESKGYYAYLEMSMHMASGTATVSSTATSTGTSSSSSDSTSSGDSTTTGTVAVHTVAGVVETVTVGGSQSTSSSSSSNSSGDSSSLSKGAVAGVVVGSVAGCVGIILLIFLVLAAKRRARANSPDPSVQNILLDGRQSKGSQMSFMKGVFSDNHSHTLSAGSSITPQRMPTFTDNRMKTDAALYHHGHHRDSTTSLQDNEDYSRPVLRLTNPD